MRLSPWSSVFKKDIPTPNKANKEGFPAYRGTPEMNLLSYLMTGSPTGYFYLNRDANLVEFADFLNNCADSEFLAKATIYARNNGYMREFPIAALVRLSVVDKPLFWKAYPRVLHNPHDWQKLIDVARSGAFRKGLGRMLKRAIISAIAEMKPYHAVKYPQAVRDMIRIARPNEKINPAVINYIMKGDHSGDELFEALAKLKAEEDPKKAAEIIRTAGLPYEVVTGSVKQMTPEIWDALFDIAPYFNFVRNLKNFLVNEVFNDREKLERAVKRLTDKEAIRKSKLFPFRFYEAYIMLKYDGTYIMLKCHEVANVLREALARAVELSVENVPPLEGKTVIAPDVSGSMSSLVLRKSAMRCYDIVRIMTGILYRKSRDVMLLPFNHELQLAVAEEVQRKFEDGENLIEATMPLGANGGTSLSAPIEYLIQNKIEVDNIIAITDNEEWVGRRFVEALNEYFKINPDVNVYLITLIPYRDYPAPPGWGRVRFIFGWSDAVLKYIAEPPEAQVGDVRRVEL